MMLSDDNEYTNEATCNRCWPALCKLVFKPHFPINYRNTSSPFIQICEGSVPETKESSGLPERKETNMNKSLTTYV